MSTITRARPAPLAPEKFQDPLITAKGETRASVALTNLKTLWLNTGTLCNIACEGCYIESSPKNDRLVYINRAEARSFLDEIAETDIGTTEIGITGGEPFMNPDILGILEDALTAGFQVLVLTNAMQPLWNKREKLLALQKQLGERLTLRVSIDHYGPEKHEKLRGENSWDPMIRGLRWLSDHGFTLHVAGRTCWHEGDTVMRAGFKRLFAQQGLNIDADDPVQCVLFPEMDETCDVPEITTACWSILDVSPDDMMCASSRMVVKRKGADAPVVVPCTLLPYDAAFDLGGTLAEADRPIQLNHPHCARFCVLGGGACSA
ncbi:MAG: radical SAM protein [Magnetovibrionaceae bacterium]